MWTKLKGGKREAKKLWREGATIGLLPCNMAYPNVWMRPCPVQKDGYIEHIRTYWRDVFTESRDIVDAAWESMYNNWAYYNTCYELGYYAHYYVEAE